MAKIELTDRTLKALRPGTKTWEELWRDAKGNKRTRPIMWDALVPGFGVRVTDRGKLSFVLVKRYPGSKSGQPVPREIGKYGELSLEKARQKARGWIELVRAGIDPADREEERNAEQLRRADTFAAAFELFVTSHLATLRTGKDVEAAMRRVLIPVWGRLPLTSITRKHVVEIIYNLHDGGSPVAANRLLAYIKKFFIWAFERGKVETSPAILVKKPAKERKRDRVLTNLEIAAIWRGCDRIGIFGCAVRLMLLTGQRRDEVGEARWSEISLEGRTWSLSRERVKNDQAHLVPLSQAAIKLLETIPRVAGAGDFVFTTTGAGPLRGWGKAKRNLDKAALQELRAVERGDGPGSVSLVDWHLHDLRRTAATGMARLGVERTVIGKVLNHAEPSVTAIYDRHRYDAQKALALNAWAAELARIIDPRTAEVMPLELGRRT